MPDVAEIPDVPALIVATRRLHEDIRARVGALLERARASGRPELASRPWQSGQAT